MADEELSDDQKAFLDQLYFENGVTTGRDKLFYYIKNNHPEFGLTRAQIEYYLKRNEYHQINSRQFKSIHIRPIMSKKPFNLLQMDLIDYARKNTMYNYVLCVVDVFSRYAWTRRLTSKEDDTVLAGLESIINDIGDQDIKIIMSDRGKEFENKAMNEYLRDKGIKHIISIGGVPECQAIVERFNKTLKGLLARFSQINGYLWSTNLAQCTKIYNKTYHRTIGMTPELAIGLDNDAQKELYERVEKIVMKRVVKNVSAANDNLQNNISVGDFVRRKMIKKGLEKHNVDNWSKEKYTVVKITQPRKIYNVIRYTLEDVDGNILKQLVRGDILKIEQ